MRRRYGDCQRADGNCAVCSLVNYGLDCHNRPITKLALARMAAEIDQPALAKASGVPLRTIQRVESGDIEAGNMTAKNLLALAAALECNPKELI